MVNLTVLADNAGEGDETVIVSLSASSSFTAGSPNSAIATIHDKPSQAWFAQNIANPAMRGPLDDADGDGVPNILEFYSSTLPSDGCSAAATSATTNGSSAVFHFKRALNTGDVAGGVQWSANLKDWYSGGQSDGTITVNISDSTSSAPTDDPQLIDATATNASGPLPVQLFFRLSVTP